MRAIIGPRWRVANAKVLSAMGKAAAKLLVGNAAAAGLSLASFALTARALGPHDFGLLLIAVAYAQTMGRLFGFQSWQVVIRFGPEFERIKDEEGFFTFIRYAWVLDAVGAIIASLLTVGVAIAIVAISSWDGFPLALALLFGLSTLCRVNGTAIGVMRLSDRFGALAIQTTLVAAAKTALIFLAVVAGAGDLTTFAAIWVVCLAVEYLAVVVQAYLTLRRKGFRAFGRAVLPSRIDGGEFRRLHITANLWTAAQSLRELDSLVVGAALSPAALALYRVGRDLCLKLNRLLDPIVAVAYPHFVRAQTKRDESAARDILLSGLLVTAALCVAVFVAYWAVGLPLIEVLFGDQFVGAFAPGFIFVGAFAFIAFGRIAAPAALAAGLATQGLLVTTVAVPPFLLLAYTLSIHLGVIGAAIAFLAYSAVTSIVVVTLVSRHR